MMEINNLHKKFGKLHVLNGGVCSVSVAYAECVLIFTGMLLSQMNRTKVKIDSTPK